LSDELVFEATKRFYSLIPQTSNQKELTFSNGCKENFKKQHGIQGFNQQREERVGRCITKGFSALLRNQRIGGKVPFL
jgi:hypothetical protein